MKLSRNKINMSFFTRGESFQFKPTLKNIQTIRQKIIRYKQSVSNNARYCSIQIFTDGKFKEGVSFPFGGKKSRRRFRWRTTKKLK